jgi:hypothetical protein
MKTPIENIEAITEAAAEAALQELRKTHTHSSFACLCKIGSAYKSDTSARQAFATRAIELYIEQEAAKHECIPSVEECIRTVLSVTEFHIGRSSQIVERIRSDILTAVQRRDAKNALALVKLRELPEKWKREAQISGSGCDACLMRAASQLETALADLDAPTEPTEPEKTEGEFEVAYRDMVNINSSQTCGIKEKDAGIERLENRETHLIAFRDDLVSKLIAAEEKSAKLQAVISSVKALLASRIKDKGMWERRYDEQTANCAFTAQQRDDALAKLATAEARLAQLEWRPVSVKPTREDGDEKGRIAVTGGSRLFVAPWNGLPDGTLGWLPFMPPPQPTAEDKERADFEEWWKTQPGDFNCGPERFAFLGWQARGKAVV